MAKNLLMDDAVWTARQLFNHVSELKPEQQKAFIVKCDASEEIKAEVLEILEHHQADDDLFLQSDMESCPFAQPALIGDYVIDEKIASGGMGIVYRGFDERLKRVVAIKVLAPYLSDSSVARDRLANEARIVARLSHPGIVQVFDIVRSDDAFAIVSQFLDGGTLEQLLSPRRLTVNEPAPDTKSGEYIPVEEAIRIIRLIAVALKHAHDQGVVHRDLKPSNILFDRSSNEPKITDFGIAKLLTQTEVLHTSAGAGTCYYMSPEQTRGESSGVTPASDIFSLGVVLYELLTNRRPFDGSTRDAVIDAIRKGQTIPVGQQRSGIPRDLQTVCMKAIEPDHRYRYKSCTEFIADLECIAAGKPILSQPPGLVRRIKEEAVSRRQVLISGAVLGLGLTSGGLFMSRHLDKRAKLRVVSSGTVQAYSLSVWAPDRNAFLPHSGPYHSSRVHRLDDGLYRVTAETIHGLRELERYIAREADLTLELPTNAPRKTHDMIEIVPPSTEQLKQLEQIDASYAALVSGVGAFKIDRFEVSNARYHEFLMTTGFPAPEFWPEHYDESWDDLPVTSISALDARAYAEWAGLRLPTYAEWLWAAKGAQADPYPWGTETPLPGSPEWGNWGRIDRYAKSGFGRNQAMWDHYLQSVKPVSLGDSKDERNGVLNLMGNVSEWTSTPFIRPNDPIPENAIYNRRFICAQSWGEPIMFDSGLDLSRFTSDHETGSVIARGFRCAISINHPELRFF